MKASQALEIFLSMNVTAFKAGAKAAGNTVTNMGGTIKRSLKVTRTAFTVGQKSVNAYKNRLKELNSTAGGVGSTLGQIAALVGGGLIFGKAGQLAVGFNSTVEQSQIGLAALVRTFNQVPEGADKYAQSMRVAGEIQRNLQIEGLKTVATYEQLLVALQEGIGPAFKQGFNPQQVVDFTSQMTQAAAALSLPMDQLGQEIRSILDATIDRNSRVAKALGITNEKVKEMAASGQLFEYLSGQLNEFKLAGEDAARTWTGAFSNLMDAVQMILGKGFDASFTATKQLFLDLRDAIVTIDEVAGTFTFNEKITAALSVADQAISNFIAGITKADMQRYLEILGQTVAAVVEMVVFFLDAMKALFDFIGPALPTIAKYTAAFVLFGGALKVLIGVPLALGKQVLALNAAFSAASGGSILLYIKHVQLASTHTGLLKTAFASIPNAIGAAGALMAAALVGWELGTFLNKFDIVKKTALGVIHTFDLGRLKIKQFWAMLTGGDTEGVEREIRIARGAYQDMIDDIDSGADKGITAQEKIAAAAKKSADDQVKSQVGALNKMGAAYDEYAAKVEKLMPGEDGNKGSDAYQSWQAIEGAGLTLDAPEDGMTKDELALFYKQQKEKAGKENTPDPDAAKEDEKHKTAKQELALAKERRKEESAGDRDHLLKKEEELYLEKQAIAERQKADQESGDWTAQPAEKKTTSSGTQTWQSKMEEQLDVNRDEALQVPEPVTPPAPVVPDPVQSSLIKGVFDEYADRTATANKNLISVIGNAARNSGDPLSDEKEYSLGAASRVPAIASPLENMKQQVSDAVAAVPASLAAMTTSSVHNLVAKLSGAGSRGGASGSQTSSAAPVPKKIIELRFPGGSLNGGERDVDAFLSHLEKAGMTA